MIKKIIDFMFGKDHSSYMKIRLKRRVWGGGRGEWKLRDWLGSGSQDNPIKWAEATAYLLNSEIAQMTI